MTYDLHMTDFGGGGGGLTFGAESYFRVGGLHQGMYLSMGCLHMPVVFDCPTPPSQ